MHMIDIQSPILHNVYVRFGQVCASTQKWDHNSRPWEKHDLRHPHDWCQRFGRPDLHRSNLHMLLCWSHRWDIEEARTLHIMESILLTWGAGRRFRRDPNLGTSSSAVEIDGWEGICQCFAGYWSHFGVVWYILGTIKLLPFRRAWSAEYAASSSGKSQHDPSPCKGYHEISYDSINYYIINNGEQVYYMFFIDIDYIHRLPYHDPSHLPTQKLFVVRIYWDMSHSIKSFFLSHPLFGIPDAFSH